MITLINPVIHTTIWCCHAPEHQETTPKLMQYPARIGRLPLFLPVRKKIQVGKTYLDFQAGLQGTVQYRVGIVLTMAHEDLWIKLYNLCFDTEHHQATVKNSKLLQDLTTTFVVIDSKYKRERPPVHFEGSIVVAVGTPKQDCITIRIPELFYTTTPMHIRQIDMQVRHRAGRYLAKALYRLACCDDEVKRDYATLRNQIAPLAKMDTFKKKVRQQLEKMSQQGIIINLVLKPTGVVFQSAHRRKN